MSDSGDLFQEWRAADRAALALEKEVLFASMRSVIAGEPDLPREAHERARKQRDLADELFVLAMDEMERRARAAKW